MCEVTSVPPLTFEMTEFCRTRWPWQRPGRDGRMMMRECLCGSLISGSYQMLLIKPSTCMTTVCMCHSERLSLTHSRTHTHTHTRAHKHTHTKTCAYAHKHRHTCTCTCALPHTQQTHTEAYIFLYIIMLQHLS